jgi:hypothetical protein
MNTVVLEKMGKSGCICNIIDCDDLQIGKPVQNDPQGQPADPAKSVDANSYSHNATSFLGFSKFTALGDTVL